MKRVFRYVTYLVISCIALLPVAAEAQNYEMDEGTPLITVVSPTGETQLTSNCTWKLTDTTNDNMQSYNNLAYYETGDYLGTLIDNDANTYWHSDPTNLNLHSDEEWIQVDLMTDTVQRFYFWLMRREDTYEGALRYGVTPTNLEIKATNTPNVANSWKTITTLTDIKPSATEGVWPYLKYIDMGAKYRYVRLYCHDSSTYGLATESYPYWTFSGLQFYAARPISDNSEILTSLIDSIYAALPNLTVGTEPGYVSEDAYAEYDMTMSKAIDVAADPSSYTQEEMSALIADVRQVINKVKKSVVPLPDGCYFIQSAYSSFSSSGTGRNMYQKNKRLRWKVADENDPAQYFVVSKASDSTYTIRSLYPDTTYVNTVPGDGSVGAAGAVEMSETLGAGQTLTPIYNGTYYLSNTANPVSYHPFNHKSGAGTEGPVIPLTQLDEVSAWKFVPADTTNLASLIAQNKKVTAAAALTDSLVEPRMAVISVKNPATGLITAASQLTSNCQWTDEYSVDKLLDHDHNTHFHSNPTGMSLFTTDEYLQVDLGRNDIKSFFIEFWGRNDGAGTTNSWHDTPNKLVITGTNTPDDETSWTDITTLTEGFTANIDNAHYVSPRINIATPYQYLRFIVKNTTSGQAYWNLSEFQLYDEIPASDNSTYAKNADVKAATDALEAAIATSEDHIASLTVDGTEIKAIDEAMSVLNEAIGNITKLKALVASATALHDSLVVFASDGLIKTVNTNNDGTNQMLANDTWTSITPDNDNYSFNAAFIEDGYNLLGALIDNNDQTYWHSDPAKDLRNTEAYFQIDLKRSDVKSFRIRLNRRNDFYNGANRHGIMPRKAYLYGTNDDAIGTDLDGSCTKWDMVTFLDAIPSEDDAAADDYVTSEITPTVPYRYLRFRPTNAGQAYWCLSGFQILEGGEGSYDHEKSQYYYVDGMKDAADKMMAGASSLQAKIDDGSATMAEGNALAADIEAVRALYQDGKRANALAKKARNIAENIEVGTGIGQVNDQSLIDNVLKAIGPVEEGSTNTATFKTNLKALEDALAALQAGVKNIEVGKWYYIKSTDDPEASSGNNLYPARTINGAALYVLNDSNSPMGGLTGRYSSGNQLRWGLDDYKGVETETDPDAIWTFEAAPDSLGANVYYIRNMRTGYYLGFVYVGGSDNYVKATIDPYPYTVEFIGKGEFHISPAAGNNRIGVPIQFGENARQIRCDSPISGFDNRSTFTFEEVNTSDISQVVLMLPSSKMTIESFPFPVSGINENEGVKAYGIHSRIDSTHIGLVEKNSFAAGEAMILVVGDTTTTTDAATAVNVNIPQVQLTTGSDTVNGLISSFPSKAINGIPGYGYIEENVLKVTGFDACPIPVHSGYIDDGLINNMDGEPDAVLEVFGDGMLNAVRKVGIAASASATVNVYTIDGVLVRQGVKPAVATYGLAKGIYIVGKKKVLVK